MLVMENNNIDEIRTLFLNQIENLEKLFENLKKSNDFEKVKIVDNISSDDLDLVYGFDEYSETIMKFRLDSLQRFLFMCDDSGLIRIDLVIWAHYRAILDRIDYLLGIYSKE